MVDFQYVFHRAHKVPIAFRRDAPTLFQPRLDFVFFQRLAHRLGVDAVNYLALDQPLRQQSQCPTGPAFRRFPAGQRNQVGFRSAIQFLWPAALLLPAPQGRFDPFLHTTAAHPFHGGAGGLEGTGATSSSVMPPSFRASSLSNRMRAWVCLYAAARPLENQGLQFLLFFRGQFDTVFLVRHDASPWMQFANADRIHRSCLNSKTLDY